MCGPAPGENLCEVYSNDSNVGYCDLGDCTIDFCDEYDGAPDLKLDLLARDFPIPAGIFIGAHLEVTSHKPYCDDCESPWYEIVRSLDDGALSFANLKGPTPGPDLFEPLFGKTAAEILDPFIAIVTIVDVDQGLCDPIENQFERRARGGWHGLRAQPKHRDDR